MAQIIIDGALPKAFNLTRKELKEYAKYFAERSARRGGFLMQQVTIILQDDELSNQAHIAIMDVEGATDVITQPYDPMPGEADGVYGELYVNCERALQRSKGAWTAEKELLLYIAHGMDHLSGADDSNLSDAMRMRRRELKWIRDLERNI
ncbi:MAG: rRNA maturation RNase YbeY [Kiritimatiellae bacterium]|nr:rRNA maturation RNase YbeY [Kiritimatiellia bacterium]